jgi:hypothetical protein
MRAMFAKDIKLSLKASLIKLAVARLISIAIVRVKDHKGLKDGRFLRAGRRTKNRTISRDSSPTKYAQPEVSRNIGKDGLVFFLLARVIGIEEDISNGIMAVFRQDSTEETFHFCLEEFVGDAGHDTSTITVAGVCSCGTSVGHCTKEMTGIRDSPMGSLALYVTDEANTTVVAFVFVAVEALVGGEGLCP